MSLRRRGYLSERRNEPLPTKAERLRRKKSPWSKKNKYFEMDGLDIDITFKRETGNNAEYDVSAMDYNGKVWGECLVLLNKKTGAVKYWGMRGSEEVSDLLHKAVKGNLRK
jgi:hypothetical protein